MQFKIYLPIITKMKMHFILIVIFIMLAHIGAFASTGSNEQNNQESVTGIEEDIQCALNVQCTSTRQAWKYIYKSEQGFFSANKLPSELTTAFNKTYLLIVTSISQDGRIKVIIPKSEFDRKLIAAEASLEKEIREKRLSTQTSSELLDLRGGNCKPAPGVSDFIICSKIVRIEACTAFATNDGLDLWTARHCLVNTYSNSSQIRVHLFSNDGIIFLNAKPEELGVTMDASSYNADNDPDRKLDFFKLKPLRKLPYFFDIGTYPYPGEITYNLGFPSETGGNIFAAQKGSPDELQYRPRSFDLSKNQGSLDAFGGTFHFSQGEVFSKMAYFLLHKNDSGIDQRLESMSSKQIILTSNDSVFGFSGGPLVNSKGEVIGIISTAGVSIFELRPRTHTIAVIPESWSR